MRWDARFARDAREMRTWSNPSRLSASWSEILVPGQYSIVSTFDEERSSYTLGTLMASEPSKLAANERAACRSILKSTSRYNTSPEVSAIAFQWADGEPRAL